ncbi:MAG: YtxH domain-containing protein [Anaerolineaceae bacterium]|jgi:gas vesicle protein|nr:YtxH domain-containing protein [Anaerolineaceae bacterium]
MERKMSNNWLTGLIIGGVVGGTIALLTAARRGEETREMIAEKGMDLRDKAITTAANTRGRVEDLASTIVDGTREKVSQLKETGRRIKNAEAEVMKECVEEAKSALTN